jgi:transcription factor IIIB subunit 2
MRIADNCGFFSKGKRIDLYAGAALYITLRYSKAPYLLVDFSDKMGIKIFPLARRYLKFAKKFKLQDQLPQIDPSLFIHKYCKLMNLEDKTEAVATSAMKIIKGMKRDWMCLGRRPSNLCGAAIMIAAAIHKVSDEKWSASKICGTVFVCSETIRRRLSEFKNTPLSKKK